EDLGQMACQELISPYFAPIMAIAAAGYEADVTAPFRGFKVEMGVRIGQRPGVAGLTQEGVIAGIDQ
ncbi:hypothetical protein RZS08_58330, partial [Arthrospira platensis SPKY1]|nr:hypothetical protein [Arthrospira platensis SPKY1]